MNRFLVPVASMLLISVASAQGLSDPTRPALDDTHAQPQTSGTTTPASSGLQTIIRRNGAKPAAIINGEYIELGGRVGEARLSAVREDSVVLSGPSGSETLMLTPGIVKTPIKLQREASASTRKPPKKMRKTARKE